MTDRKRPKLGNARRLHGYVDELLDISGDIGQCAFPRKASTTRVGGNGGALPLRVVPRPAAALEHTSSIPPATGRGSRAHKQQQQQKQQQQRQSPKPLAPPSTLFSVVSASSLAAKATAAASTSSTAAGRDAWKHTLLQAARELSATDLTAEDRAGRLLRRFDALSATVAMLADQNARLASDILVNERVEAQLEAEERAWEAKMQTKEQRVAALQVALIGLRDGGDDVNDDVNDDDVNDADDDVHDDDTPQQNVELRETLALRMEEKRDMCAALASLQLRQQQQRQQTRRSSDDANTATDDVNIVPSALLATVQELRQRKDALQRQIIAREEAAAATDADRDDVPALERHVAAAHARRRSAHERLDAARVALARRKARVKQMVDVQLLTARDTHPTQLREEAVILHLLDTNAGEMGVSDLKRETVDVMATYGKASASGAVVRALYSLVANGVVTIDRSYGNGLVTSLLV